MRDFLIFFTYGAIVGTSVTLITMYISDQKYKRNKAHARKEHLARAQELLEEEKEITDLCTLDD